MTLLLSRSDLTRMLDIGTCLAALRQGFLAAPAGIAAQRVRTELPGPGTATALIPGLAGGIPAYSVKGPVGLLWQDLVLAWAAA